MRRRRCAGYPTGRDAAAGASLGGLPAAALIALILLRPGTAAPSVENAGMLLDGFDIVADAYNFETIQDVEPPEQRQQLRKQLQQLTPEQRRLSTERLGKQQ